MVLVTKVLAGLVAGYVALLVLEAVAGYLAEALADDADQEDPGEYGEDPWH